MSLWLTTPSYLVFLKNALPELLKDVPLSNLQDDLFERDGAPVYFEHFVRDHLNIVYDHQWIPPVPWSPRSPDLNRLDIFYWCKMKKPVDKAPVEDGQELVLKTFAAAGAAEIQDDSNVFQNIRENV